MTVFQWGTCSWSYCGLSPWRSTNTTLVESASYCSRSRCNRLSHFVSFSFSSSLFCSSFSSLCFISFSDSGPSFLPLPYQSVSPLCSSSFFFFLVFMLLPIPPLQSTISPPHYLPPFYPPLFSLNLPPSSSKHTLLYRRWRGVQTSSVVCH